MDPEKRITISELIVHPWVNKKYTQTLKWKSIYDVRILNVLSISSNYGLNVDLSFMLNKITEKCRR